MRSWHSAALAIGCAGLIVGLSWNWIPWRAATPVAAAPDLAGPSSRLEPAPAPGPAPLLDNPAELRQEKAAVRRQFQALQPEQAHADSGAADGAAAPEAYGLAPDLPAIDPLMPAPGDVPLVWQPLDKAVREIAGGMDGRMSVVAIDLTSGARYEFRPNDRYYPASTFKLPVTLCTVEAIDRGDLAWDTLVTFTPEDDDTVGQGGFATVEYGTKWPVRNLLDRSIISSNNVAVKMLARTLTLDGLAACTAKIGGMVTRNEQGSTPVSARDEAAWWLHLWQMKQERPKVAENLLSPLRRVTYTGRIQDGTPRPDLVTHKFGTYSPYEHDGALIWGDRPYILVVMTYTHDHYGIDWTISRVAAAAWDSIMTQR
jgi:beta-lactamase class A